MTKVDSTSHPRPRKARKLQKPKKPHKDFPLCAHPNGQWCKSVRGKVRFFGVWAEPQAALERWLDEKDDLLAGRIPRSRTASANATNLRDLCCRVLVAKKSLVDGGERSGHTWIGIHEICDELGATFTGDRLLTDIQPEDFQKLREHWSKKWGVQRLRWAISKTRMIFNYAFKNGMIDRPIRFGADFEPPAIKAMRKNKAARGAKMFEADELRKMIDAAKQPLRSMLLLAINCALGNEDVAQLPIDALNLAEGWLDYPRTKTGIMRRCPLWPETVEAVRDWLERRPTPRKEDCSGLLFLTARDDGWASNLKDRALTHECAKLLDRLKIRRGGRGFYGARHSFENTAGETLDQVAVNAIMGHSDGTQAENYRHRISDGRLKTVAEFVRGWLFAKPQSAAGPVLKIADESAGDAAASA